MLDIFEKHLWRKILLILLSAVYLIIYSVIPLSHTCNHHEKKSQEYHFGCQYHSCSIQSSISVPSEVFLIKNVSGTRNRCLNDLCVACIFSKNCHSFEINHSAKYITSAIVLSFQLIPESVFIDQFEWTCSVLLRGPLFLIS
jgi:hypothetical protein